MLIIFSVSSAVSTANAAQIFISPTDSYPVIEAAQPGDEVIIAPGTYRFRVHLDMQGTAAMPVIVRGADPANPPVFDYTGQELQTWPGSYAGVEAVRGAWFITGTHIVLQDIEVTGAFNNGGNYGSAGFRFLSPTSRGQRLNSHHNQIGVEIGGATIEDSVLSDNATSVAHYGFKSTLRNTLLQRATINLYNGASDLTVEGCWFEPPTDYHFHIDACAFQCGGTSNTQTIPRTFILSGNIFRVDPTTGSSFVTYLDGRAGPNSVDGTGRVPSTDVYLLHNTFVHTDPASFPGRDAVLTQGTNTSFRVFAYGNVTDGFGDAWNPNGATTLVGSGGNWATNGTNGLFPSTLLGPSPLWVDAANLDFRPAATSPLIGMAPNPTGYAPIAPPALSPTLTPLSGRVARLTVREAGAFEAPANPPDAGPDAGVLDAGSPDGGLPDGGSLDGGLQSERRLTVGCGCNAPETAAISALFSMVIVAELRRRLFLRPPTRR